MGIPEDPAFSTGGMDFQFSHASTFLFGSLIIFKIILDINRGLNEVFKTVIVFTISWSNIKLFTFENWF